MASHSSYLSLRKVFILSFFTLFFGFSISETQTQIRVLQSIGRRRSLLDSKDANVEVDNDFLVEVIPRKKKSSSSNDVDDDLHVKKKSLSSSQKDESIIVPKKKLSSSISSSNSSKNQTNIIIKPKITNLDKKSSKKDETKLTIKPSLSTSSKNKTKLIKSTSKGVNLTSKSSNSTKPITKKSLDPTKSKSNSTTTTTKNPKQVDKAAKSSKSDTPDQKIKQISLNQNQKQKQKQNSPSLPLYDEDEDLISEFRDLPTKFQKSFIPDLHRISSTSKIYLNKYNKEFTNGFKPYVGNKYASSLATAISCAFIVIPFLLVSLVFNQIKAYFSLQKLIIFIQIYLSIYFTILCISTLITGIEPLKFFYVTSQFTYVWLQVLQTLFYVLYLLLLLMYLILVFSTKSDMGQKVLGLAQTLVGFAVGLHYYMTVFHRVVLRQPPKSSWKIHGIYATCFFVICLFASLERRKKAYLVEGDEEGKTS